MNRKRTNQHKLGVTGSRGGAPARAALASLLTLCVCGGATALWAQVPGGQSLNRQLPQKTYMSKNVFFLPIIIDGRVRAGLREVQLFYKDHPSKPWMFKEKAPPTQEGFTYRAPQDGEYWFTVVTVDKSGRANPADLTREMPGLIVVLDTQPPQIDVRLLSASQDGLFLQCEVRDANVDPGRTRVEYQTANGQWHMLDPQPDRPDTYCIPKVACYTGIVKVAAEDRVGNKARRELDLLANSTASAPAAPPGTNPVFNTPVTSVDPAVERASAQAVPLPNAASAAPVVQSAEVVTSHTVETPVATVGGPALTAVERTPPSPPPTVPPIPTVTAGPTKTVSSPVSVPSPISVPSPAQETIARKIPEPQLPRQGVAALVKQIVNNSHVFLEYEIEATGPSGPGTVVIWVTSDQGQSWRKLCEDPNRRNPAEVDLPGEGLYGVTLAVTNGRGFGGEPPRPGDSPAWWVEVDVTKPTAELLTVRPGSGDEGGDLQIAWTARDKNLGTEPIDLFYATSREGPWLPIAKGLKNDGQYRWPAPKDVGAAVFVRLAATDKAGNTCQCETPQAVKLDDGTRPRAHVIGVSTGDARLTAPTGH